MPKAPPNANRFKKGQSGNPNGSSERARELAAIKKLSTQQVAEVGTLLLENDRVGLKELATSNEKPFLQVWTAALMLKGYTTGNPAVYNAVLDRIIGKPKEFRELTGSGGGPVQVQSLDDIEERLAAIRRLKKETGND